MRAAGAMAVTALVAALAGCVSTSDLVVGPPATAVAVTSGPTPTTSPTTAGTATATPSASSAAPAPTPNPALTAALGKLAADSRALRSNASLAAVRNGVNAGLSTSRKGLAVTRAAAYQSSVRSCSRVSAGLSATRSGAATVTRAAAVLPGAASTRQKQLASLQASITTVRRLAAAQKPGALPTAAEISAAVKVALAQYAEESASLAATRSLTADGVTRARGLVATATDIYYKAC